MLSLPLRLWTEPALPSRIGNQSAWLWKYSMNQQASLNAYIKSRRRRNRRHNSANFLRKLQKTIRESKNNSKWPSLLSQCQGKTQRMPTLLLSKRLPWTVDVRVHWYLSRRVTKSSTYWMLVTRRIMMSWVILLLQKTVGWKAWNPLALVWSRKTFTAWPCSCLRLYLSSLSTTQLRFWIISD